MAEILQILEAARKSLETVSTSPRYKFGIALDDAKQLILAAYRGQIKARGHEMIEDQAAMARIASAAEWLTGDHKPGLLLYGGVGNGKTTLAKSIANAVTSFERAVSAWENDFENWTSRNVMARSEVRNHVTLPAPLEISAIQVSRRAKNDHEAYVKTFEAQFLVLDDLGCEPPVVKNFGNEISPVSELLYSRYETLLPTILTTNLDKAGIKDFYGPRIADRLEEMCDCIGFKTQSYRK